MQREALNDIFCFFYAEKMQHFTGNVTLIE